MHIFLKRTIHWKKISCSELVLQVANWDSYISSINEAK